jgi:hypothetical protein
MYFRLALVLAGLSLAPAMLLTTPASAAVAIGISVNIAPPELPVYEQPPIPGPGFLWSPGYWAWGGEDYYWVPGTWVEAPEPGLLWTPGYWGWGDGAYLWHEGYWGPHVGFYGGVNYGFGYGGRGYEGGEWRGRSFFYNRSVNNVPESVHITNVYNRTVVNNVTVNRVSFNGGHGGVDVRPNAQEANFDRERHVPPVSAQVHHAEAARSEPALHNNANHGAPGIAATAHAASFTGPGVVHARGAGPVAPHAAGGPAGAPAGAGAAHPGTPEPQIHNVQHTAPPTHTAPATHAVEPPHAAPPAPAAQPQAHELRPQTPAGHPGGPPGAGPVVPRVEQHSAPPQHEPAAHAPATHEPPRGGNEHEHESH